MPRGKDLQGEGCVNEVNEQDLEEMKISNAVLLLFAVTQKN